MKPIRPDLSKLPSEIQAYIAALESEIERLSGANRRTTGPRLSASAPEAELEDLTEISEPAEPPTTINVITITSAGVAKRTPRHLYTRQRRGGMGVFDLETSETDPPVILTIADQSQTLLLITNLGRAFRLPVNAIIETPLRARGSSISSKFNLPADERLLAAIPEQAQGYLALCSQSGMIRMLRHHVFGEYMKPGIALYEYRTFGPFSSACWTSGESDLFVATRQGRAIRFSEKMISPQGTQAIRLSAGDQVVGITAVSQESGVLLMGADGKGSIRLMRSFAPNKAPGAGGKVALDTDQLICALNIDNQDDLFVISQLCKIIRFHVSEIPPKEGVVQGVNCMSLRADRPVAVALNPQN